MGRKKLVTHKRLMEAIVNCHGLVSVIAHRLNVTWPTAKTALINDEEAMELFEYETEKVLDKAESNIIKAINNEDLRVSQWYLEKKGVKRGYNPTINIDEKQETQITFVDNLTSIGQ